MSTSLMRLALPCTRPMFRDPASRRSVRLGSVVGLGIVLSACATQTPTPGSLFDADARSRIDALGRDQVAHLWTAAGLPDNDTRTFVLAIDPDSKTDSVTVKLPSGASGVVSYGTADDQGCRSATMASDFRAADGKVRQGERVGLVLCPPTLFGSWQARSVAELAQAKTPAPPKVAALPPPRRPTSNRRGRPAPSVAPTPASVPEPVPEAAPTPVVEATIPEQVVTTAAPPMPVTPQVPKQPSQGTAKPKATAAPWKPAVQTDL